MNDDPISRIEAALAAGPTSGEWDADFASAMRNGSPAVVEYFVRRDGEDISIAADIVDPETGLPSQANAAFIAACNTVAIRALLDRLKDLEMNGSQAVRWAPSSAHWSSELRRLFGADARDGIGALEQRLRDAEGECERLRAELAEAKRDADRHRWLGHDLPSLDRLDAAIERALAEVDRLRTENERLRESLRGLLAVTSSRAPGAGLIAGAEERHAAAIKQARAAQENTDAR